MWVVESLVSVGSWRKILHPKKPERLGYGGKVMDAITGCADEQRDTLTLRARDENLERYYKGCDFTVDDPAAPAPRWMTRPPERGALTPRPASMPGPSVRAAREEAQPMMGYNHATMSAAAGIATLPIVDLPTPAQKVAWVLACAGMGLLPDWDKNGSHVSRMWGWPSRIAADGIGALAGGHRWGTHDVVLAPLALAAAFALAPRHPATQLLALSVAFGLALRGLVAMRAGTLLALANIAVSWGAAWMLVQRHQTDLVSWLPLAAALGVLTHALGDLLTDEGLPIPIIWIWTRGRFSLALFTTNGILEQAVVTPTLTITALWATQRATGYTSLEQIGHDAHALIAALIPALLNLT